MIDSLSVLPLLSVTRALSETLLLALGFVTVTLPFVTVSLVHFLPPSKETYTLSDFSFLPAAAPSTVTGTLSLAFALAVLEVDSAGLKRTTETGRFVSLDVFAEE